MVAYPHQQLKFKDRKKRLATQTQNKPAQRNSRPRNAGKSITKRVRLASPTIDGSQPVKHLLVINISPLRIASLIKVSKRYLTSQF